MGGFLYYFPGRTSADLTDAAGNLNRAALPAEVAEVLSDVQTLPADASLSDVHANGPDGSSGVLLVPRSAHSGYPSVPLNKPGRQDWYQTEPGYWIGWVKGEVPTALDLQREKTVRGLLRVDGCGDKWLIPIARSPIDPLGALPKSYTFARQGVQSHLRSEWQWLWDLAGQVKDLWDIDNPPLVELVAHVPAILRVNYRVGPNELNALHAAGRTIVTEEFCYATTSALLHCDIIKQAEEQKKTDGSDNLPEST